MDHPTKGMKLWRLGEKSQRGRYVVMDQRKMLSKEDSNKKWSTDSEREIKGSEDKGVHSRTLLLVSVKTYTNSDEACWDLSNMSQNVGRWVVGKGQAGKVSHWLGCAPSMTSGRSVCKCSKECVVLTYAWYSQLLVSEGTPSGRRDVTIVVVEEERILK